MTYTALLLGPDDDVIAEYAVPTWQQCIQVAKPHGLDMARWAESEFDVMTTAPSFTVVRFFFQRYETAIHSILQPDILIYRQEGWERDDQFANV